MNLITLRHDDMTAIIAPEKGATPVQLTKGGVDFLYRDDKNLRSPERPRCGVPFLFPMFGRLVNETYVWAGKEYHMGIHGFAHTSRWTVESQSENSALLVLEATPETMTQYPFDFRVEMRLKLEETGLGIYLKFQNTGDVPMPYNYGFHPYFLAETPEHIQVEANAGARIDFATGKALPFSHDTLTLTVPPGAPEAGAALAQIASPTVLHIPPEGRELTMEYDDSFNQLVLWTQAGKKFLCVEPINGSPNGLNTGKYMTLNSGETKEAFLRLCPRCI